MAVAAKLMRPLGLLFLIPIVISTAFFLYSFIDSFYILRYCWFYWVFMILGPTILLWGLPNIVFLLLAIRYLTKFNKPKVKSNVTGVKSPYSANKIVSRILIAVVLISLFILSFLLIVLTAVVAWHSTHLEPVRTGAFTFLPGIKGTRVSIDRDPNAVTRIRIDQGAHKADLAFGQAWAHMADRQHQIDFYHRIATGRLSTVIGERGLQSDKFMRALNFKKHAQDTIDSGQLAPSTVEWLESYAAGINAYVASPRNMIPWEMWIEGHSFNDGEKWTPADSLAILKLWQWSLSSNYVEELNRLRLLVEKKLSYSRVVDLDGGYLQKDRNDNGLSSFPLSAVGIHGSKDIEENILSEDKIIDDEAQFWFTFQKDKLGITPVSPSQSSQSLESIDDLETDVDSIEDMIETAMDPSTSFFGSPFKTFGWAWVGTSETTTGGQAVNVAELEGRLSMPNQMYLCSLKIEEGEVAKEATGASLPGVPGIIMGRTGSFSWSLVPSNADNTDLFIIEEAEKGVSYRKGASTVKYEIREEIIEVRGLEEPVKFTVKDSVHGPVLDESFLSFEMPSGFTVALQWAPHHMVDINNNKKHDRTIEVFADVWTMQQVTLDDVGEVFERKFDAPPAGIFYTDAELEYNAAFFYVGAVPIRKHTGMFPADSRSGDHDWPNNDPSPAPKFIPARIVPLANHFYMTASNRFVPRGDRFVYGYDFADDFRARVLSEMIEKHLSDRSSDDWDFIQNTFSNATTGMWSNDDPNKFHFKQLLETMPENRLTTDLAKERRKHLLTEWDGMQEGWEAGIFQAWWFELSRLTARETGVKYWNRPASILRILLENNDPICASMVEGSGSTKDCLQFAAEAFERALQNHGGLDWGSGAPYFLVDHDLYYGGNFYACACSRPSFSKGGMSPNYGPSRGFASRHGAVYRQVHNYNKYTEMKMMISGAQSGNQWEWGLYDNLLGRYINYEFVDAALGLNFETTEDHVLVLSRGK